MNPPFWKKPLGEMTPEEWEALCDGCGLCCLYKLEDVDGDIHYTSVACQHLDLGTCRCRSYQKRFSQEVNCIPIDSKTLSQPAMLPQTCAYRLLFEGKNLKAWHPLISKDAATVKEAGISANWFALPAAQVDLEQIEDYVLEGVIN